MQNLRKHALALKDQGKPKEALRLFREAYVGMIGTSKADQIGRIIIDMASTLYMLDNKEAQVRFGDAYDIALRTNDSILMGMALHGLANYASLRDEHQKAYDMYQQAFELLKQDKEKRSYIQGNMVLQLIEMKELGKAEQMILACIEEADYNQLGKLLVTASIVYDEMGDLKKAWSMLLRALTATENILDLANVLENMAAILDKTGHSAQALILDSKAYKIYSEAYDPDHFRVVNLLSMMDEHLYNARGWKFWRTYESFLPNHAISMEFITDLVSKVQL